MSPVRKRTTGAPVSTPQSSDLRALLATRRKQNRVIGPVERHLLTRPPDNSRSSLFLHPSEICKDDWCLRASYRLLNGAKPIPTKVSPRLESIFEEGHEIHRKWQQWWAEMGVLYGTWETDGVYQGWRMSGDVALPNSKYREVPIYHEYLRIGGHADGWLVGLGDDMLAEIKSIGTGTLRYEAPALLQESLAKSFAMIRGPFTPHLIQANIYGFILEEMYSEGRIERRPPDEIVFIYECKENQDRKEFVAKRSTDMISGLLARVEDLVNSLEEPPPPCNINPDTGCPKCTVFEEDAE